MSFENVNAIYDFEHHRCILGNEPLIFHCHHYNNYLQRTICEDAPYVNSRPFLVGAAAEVSYSQLKKMFSNQSIDERKKLAEDIFQWAGFGRVHLKDLTEQGGVMKTDSTHYAQTWLKKFGHSENPVDYFTTGWLAGALAAIYNLPLGSFSSEQTKCLSVKGHASSEFVLKKGPANYNIYNSVGPGNLSNHAPVAVEKNNVDYNGILQALTGMPIVGNDEGLIPAFGVYLTRHYANYYNRISFEFVKEMTNQFGAEGREAAEPLLVEAGHVCAFYTFGGIMTSAEWDALIKPSLKTKEDWVHGIVAAVNAFGWGRWQVTNVSEKGATFTIHDDYESVGYESMYGKSSYDVSFLALGGVAGILDLVYLGNIESKPVLDTQFYSKLFKGENSYKFKAKSSRAKGDKTTVIEVYR